MACQITSRTGSTRQTGRIRQMDKWVDANIQTDTPDRQMACEMDARKQRVVYPNRVLDLISILRRDFPAFVLAQVHDDLFAKAHKQTCEDVQVRDGPFRHTKRTQTQTTMHACPRAQ